MSGFCTPERMQAAISGAAIFGDDFSADESAVWFADEAQGYGELDHVSTATEGFAYQGLNDWHARKVRVPVNARVLGFGAAGGAEVLGYTSGASLVAVVEPSDRLRAAGEQAHPDWQWCSALPDGRLPFADGSFDLITCFGVLHHIPTVSATVAELARVLAPGGVLLVREPTHSMGDWTWPRPSLTRWERGLPADLLTRAMSRAGLRIDVADPCCFSLFGLLARKTGRAVYRSKWLCAVDALVCRLTARRGRVYHATSSLQRVRPTAVYVIASRA